MNLLRRYFFIHRIRSSEVKFAVDVFEFIIKFFQRNTGWNSMGFLFYSEKQYASQFHHSVVNVQYKNIVLELVLKEVDKTIEFLIMHNFRWLLKY